LDELAQYNHVDYFQSFAKFREKGLPSRLLAEKEHAIRQDPQLLEFESKVQRLKRRGSPASEIKAVESKARTYRARLIKKNLKQYQFEWVRERRDWKIKILEKERADNETKTDLLEILLRMMPERSRLAKTMISDHVISEEERRQVIEDLCSLASQDCTVLYRPGEKPVHGLCPVEGCSIDMNKYSSILSGSSIER